MADETTRPITSTRASLIALLGGLAVGSVLEFLGHPTLHQVASWMEPLGGLWIRALRMIVLPLVLTQLLVAVLHGRQAGSVGRLAGLALALFVALLLVGAVYTFAVGIPALQWIHFDPQMVESLQPVIPESAIASAATGSPSTNLGDWLVHLVPDNVMGAAARGDLLPMIVFTVLFGFAISAVAPARRDRLTVFFEDLTAVVFQLVRWILWWTPLGVFALSLGFARQAGLEVASILFQFAAYQSALLIGGTLLLYLLVIPSARVSPGRFARMLWPAQILAVSSRSSLATVPSLLIGADREKFPRQVSRFVIPFAASTFKISRTISAPAKLLFVAHIYGIQLSPSDAISFLVVIILLSFSTVGVPGGASQFRSLPAYLAAGLPIEGVVLMEAVEVIPDIFKTLINTTGYGSAAVLLARTAEPETEEPIATKGLPATP